MRQQHTMTIVGAVAIVHSCCLPLPTLDAQPTQGESILNRMLQCYQDHQQQLNPLWVQHENTVHETADLKKAEAAIRKAKTLSQVAPTDLEWQLQAEYACKGVKRKTWSRTNRPDVPNAFRERFRLFNGEISIWPSRQSDVYYMSRKSEPIFSADWPLSVTGEVPLLATLKLWADGKQKISNVIVSPAKPQSNRELVLVQFTFADTGWQNNCWVYPDLGYAPQRWEEQNEKKSLVDVWQADSYETYRGVVFPTSGQKTHYLPSGKLSYTVRFRVTKVETEPARIPDSLFHFDLPENATLWDDDNKVMVRNTALTEAHLDEVVRNIRPPPSLWRYWVIAAAVLGAVATLIAVLIWRRIRKLPQKAPRGNPAIGDAHATA